MPENTIGEAYLQIKPSMEGISGEISRAMGDEGEKASSSFGSSFASGLKKLGTVALAATTAAGAGVGALAKSAVSGFADYQQLIGGVETLFGESASIVQANAEKAFATAGMSANEYMETVTSFSASLLQSLGGDTKQAADVADMALRDMSDNANKMGTSMEAIENAYQGFAKQNYTMLDNLKLGYGGTKTEMERLLADASKLSGIEYNIESLSDVYKAINVIQRNLGITGTTAKEAGETISGSAASIGAAWKNLVAGLANPDADLGDLIDRLVKSGTTALNNLLPTIQQALLGIGKAILQLTPIIAQMLPELLSTLLPVLLEAAMTLVNSLAAALPDIAVILIEQIPLIMDNIVTTLISLLPLLVETGLQLILALADGLIQALPELIPAIVDVILTIVEKLTDPDTIIKLVDAALQIIIALAEGLLKALPKLVEKAPVIIMNLVKGLIQALPQILIAAAQLIATLITGIFDNIHKIFDIGKELVESVKKGFMEKVEAAKNWGKDLISNFIGGITEKWDKLKETVSGVAGKVKDFLGFSEPAEGPLSDFHTYAPDMIDLFAKGIRNNIGKIESAMSLLTDNVSTDMTATTNLAYSTPNRTYADSNMSRQGAEMSDIIYRASYLGLSRALKENGSMLNGFEPATTDDLFVVMRKKASNYNKMTGNSAFA